MPIDNNFSHAKYSRSNPGDRVRFETLESGAPPESPAWTDAMSEAGRVMAQSQVRAVVFLYGGWIGSDLFGAGHLDKVGGLKRGYSRGIPGLESLLSLLRPTSYQIPEKTIPGMPPFPNEESVKDRIDGLVGESGNVTKAYAALFENGINRNTDTPISCRRYLWSSRNHHVGRVEGALSFFQYLLDLCQEESLDSRHRILLVAHGHAGQLLTLLSNFLAMGESSSRDIILESLATYSQQSGRQSSAFEHFHKWAHLLEAGERPPLPTLDIVTLGTPIRTGWETSSIGHLLHIVNHRPMRNDDKRWLAKMELPQITMEMPAVMGGDYVQQLAIAGTDALPSEGPEEELNNALSELLEPYQGFERWLECARRVTRCANDGQCLLIDYQDAGNRPPAETLFGHACYTRSAAMLFQTRKVIDCLYVPTYTSSE